MQVLLQQAVNIFRVVMRIYMIYIDTPLVNAHSGTQFLIKI